MKAETSINSEELLATLDKKKSTQKKIALHFKKIELINEIKSRIKNVYANGEPEENLIYGLSIFFFESENKIKKGLIYINEKEENSLIFLDLKSKQTVRIQLSKLADINLSKNSGNFKVCESKIKKLDEQKCLTLHLKDKTKFYDFVFNTKKDLDLLCLGIASVLENNINEAKNLKRDIISLKQIWKQYVSDQDKKHLNFQQFSKFLRTISFKWKKKTDEQIFEEIDVKKQGKINFKDFISFYEFLVTGEEFTEIFQKYSSDEEKKYITIRGLLDFIEKEQHLKVSMQDIFMILHKFSKKGRRILEANGLLTSIRDGVVDAEDYANNINDLHDEEKKNNENLNQEASMINLKADAIQSLKNNLMNFPKNSKANLNLNNNLNNFKTEYKSSSNPNLNMNLNNNENPILDKNNIAQEAQASNKPSANSSNNIIPLIKSKSLYANPNTNSNTNYNSTNQNLIFINNINNNSKNNNNQKSGANLNSNIKNNIDHESLQAIYDNHSFGKNNILDEIKEFKNEDLYSAFCLSFREFVNFLIDKSYNSIYNHDLFSLHQNMNLPINDYFIYSSHNTYLEGNQMIGNSSIDMYINCLKNGCRLVELDCWDGKTGPIITHWHFPVNKLDFKEVLVNIRDIAFKKSPYPVIFSIENHCNNTSQEMMAQYFLDVLGKENLYIVDTENPPLAYPSPNDLQRKFIIKCKRKRILGKKDDIKKLLIENNNFIGTGAITANNNNFNLCENVWKNSYTDKNNQNLISNNPAVLLNNSGNNNLLQENNNSFFCNLEADSVHINNDNKYYMSSNHYKKIGNELNFYENQNQDKDRITNHKEQLLTDNLNNINNNDYDDKNDLIALTMNSNNKNLNNNHINNGIFNKSPYNQEETQNLNNSINNNATISQHNPNLINSNNDENKKNILRMMQKEEIIEEVNSINSFKNSIDNEGQLENLLDYSNENIEINTDRYQTREGALVTCINENKKSNREKFYQQKIQNIYHNKKIYDPISKINKNESVENLRKILYMSPLHKDGNLSSYFDENLNKFEIHSFIEVNKLDENNFKELDEEVDQELNDIRMKRKFEFKNKEYLILESEKDKDFKENDKSNNKLLLRRKINYY